MKQVEQRLHAIIGKQLHREFVKFCLVGAVGFVVNLSTLTLTHNVLGLPVELAVILGGEVALVSNFLFHNYWTYKKRYQNKKIGVLFLQFHVAFWSGNGINAILTLLMIKQLGWSPAVSLAIASAAVLFWNFVWTRFYIWRAKDITEEI